MKHNLIADIVKPRWFLKIVWANFLVNNLRYFTYELLKARVQHLHVQIVCMSNIIFFIIPFTGLLCDDSSSLTYEPRKSNTFTYKLIQTGSDLSLLDISFQYFLIVLGLVAMFLYLVFNLQLSSILFLVWLLFCIFTLFTYCIPPLFS